MNTTTQQAITTPAQAAELRTSLVGELRRELDALRAKADDSGDDELSQRVARIEGQLAGIDQELSRLADRVYVATVQRDDEGWLVALTISPLPT